MSGHKIIEGLQQAARGEITRANFYADLSCDIVHCPRCDMPSSWSAPDDPPMFCVGCGIEFVIRQKR